MATVIEGVWEDVAARGQEFAGRRVRVVVGPPAAADPHEAEAVSDELPDLHRRLLALHARWSREPPPVQPDRPLSEVERAVVEKWQRRLPNGRPMRVRPG